MFLFCIIAFLVTLVIGIVGVVRRRNKQYILWFILSAVLLTLTVLSSFTFKSGSEISNDSLSQTITMTTFDTDWAEQVNGIANIDLSETEKSDQISNLAKSYKLEDRNELRDYEKYLVNQFKSKEYLRDTKNDHYMLVNIFIATVVDIYYNDSDNRPIKAFAFDFLQNTKYTYRGVNAVDSDVVKENEEQMTKALEKIK
ncbi:hypothetical protein [Paenibacillus sp. MMO-58]|uniref:hypothetical protein n=1 Tax=Paenibacillus sp. MMO-58 TaxID=3081290 RepID=UPI00301AF4D2